MTRSNIIDFCNAHSLKAARATGANDIEAAAASIHRTVLQWDKESMNRKIDLVCSKAASASLPISIRNQVERDAT